jgi:integrase
MPAKILDAKFIKTGLLCPEHRAHIEYTSSDRNGLYIEVRSTSQGQGTYWFRFKDDSNRTARIKIGRTIDVTLQQAKAQVATLRAKKQLGQDIAGEERKRKHSITWNEFFDGWYLPHVKQHKRSWANDAEMQRLRISERFGDTKLNKFSRHAVQQWLNELLESGLAPSTCSHHGKLLRQALNLAQSWQLLESNPIAGIKLFSVDNRIENIMTADQLQHLVTTLDNVGDRRKIVAQVIKFLLFTGARVNEALNARWKDIDRTNRTWTVLATNSKSKRRRSIPLNNAAIAVLDALDSEGTSTWLFTSVRGDGNQRLTTINKPWAAIRLSVLKTDPTFPPIRLHDLRHGFASMLVNSGRTLFEVQQILGHSDSKVTERYAHLSTATLQAAANSASDYLDKVLDKKK